MLSWLGSLGIFIFFLWHIIKLRKEVTSVRESFERIRPRLVTLITERGDVDRERFIHDHEKRVKPQVCQRTSSNARIDSDDLKTIETEMQKEPMFSGLWLQYRMTLILECVPWFMEPRIFSTKRAEEVFTHEALIANRVNLSFYSQFPSMVTGLGLLLTFMALFIGLGKLHADGSEIVGIQGLINGLAGKFLTSIVGLIVANVFTFMEKPMMGQLMSHHRNFLRLMDQLFPRKTMEQMLEQLTSMYGGVQGDRLPAATTRHEPSGGPTMNGLAGPLASLASVIQSLKRMQDDEQIETRRTIAELPRQFRDEIHPSLQELTDTIHDLTKILKDAQPLLATVESPFEQRPLLWKNAADVMNPSATIRPAKAKSWPRWPSLSKLRATE